MRPSRVGPLVGLLVPAVGTAYETDPVTRRSEPLADAAPWIDPTVDAAIDAALADANRSPGCDATDDRLRRKVARGVMRRLGTPERLPGAGFYAVGHCKLTVPMESGAVERVDFRARDDLFASARATESLVLHHSGPCANVEVAGVRIGTDKLYHFFDEGYSYLRRGRWGARDERAIAWGTHTERTYLGLWTSNAFSYADLEANFAGYQFYAGLLGHDSVVQRDAGGCAVRVGSFDVASRVRESWNELVNPPVYTNRVAAVVTRALDARGGAVCEGPRPAPTLGPAPTAGPTAPPRLDPFRLDERCPGPTPEGTSIPTG